MRQNIKRIFAVLMLTLLVLGLSACGSTTAVQTELPFDEAYLQSVASALVEEWNVTPAEELQKIAEADTEVLEENIKNSRTMGYLWGCFHADSLKTAYAGYLGSMEELGTLVSQDSFEPMVIKGDEVSIVVNLTYANRPAKLEMVFNKRGIVESATLAPEYTTGEILKKAGMNTILGMGTVFIVLIFISLIIYCFNFIPGNQVKKPQPDPAPKPRPAKKPAPHKPAAKKENLIDDGELVAAITAAICAYRGTTSSDGFVVRSIRRAESSTWKKV